MSELKVKMLRWRKVAKDTWQAGPFRVGKTPSMKHGTLMIKNYQTGKFELLDFFPWVGDAKANAEKIASQILKHVGSYHRIMFEE